MEIIKVKNLSEYIKAVNRNILFDSAAFYRGQIADYKLLPKIFRDSIFNGTNLLDIEHLFLDEFKKKGRTFLNYEPKNDLEWLAIAQHHGLKTRLLDWSENALAALWFCVCVEKESPLDKGNGVVWILKIDDNSSLYVDEKDYIKPFDIKFTKIFKPSYLSNRIIAQSGVFTLHKFLSNDKDAIPIEEDGNINKYLTKVLIPYKCFKDLKKNLMNCGIHSAQLFPDLDGLCSFINYQSINREEIQKIINLTEAVFEGDDEENNSIRKKIIKSLFNNKS